jgi:hypothetical protein
LFELANETDKMLRLLNLELTNAISDPVLLSGGESEPVTFYRIIRLPPRLANVQGFATLFHANMQGFTTCFTPAFKEWACCQLAGSWRILRFRIGTAPIAVV